MEIIAVAAMGLIIGSFLTVCIYRIPYGRSKGVLLGQEESEGDVQETTEGESDLVQPEEDTKFGIGYPPRSFCPKCKSQLAWYCNVPLFSWIFLGGKCAYCKEPIPIRYPLVELMSAVSALMCYSHFGLTATSIVIYLFCASLIVITFIDIDYFIIPNVISYPGTLLGILLAVVNEFTDIFSAPLVGGVVDSGLGLLFGAGFLLAVAQTYMWLRKKEGLGLGDVKLLAMTGAFFGYKGSLFTIFIGSLAGSVIGILLTLIGGRKFSQQLPFGPYLALGTFLYIFYGDLYFAGLAF